MKTMKTVLADAAFLSQQLTPEQRREYTTTMQHALDDGADLYDTLIAMIGMASGTLNPKNFDIGDRVHRIAFNDTVTGNEEPEQRDLFVMSTHQIVTNDPTFPDYQRIEAIDSNGHIYEGGSHFFELSKDQRAITPRMAIGSSVKDRRGRVFTVVYYPTGETVELHRQYVKTGDVEVITASFSQLQTYKVQGEQQQQ